MSSDKKEIFENIDYEKLQNYFQPRRTLTRIAEVSKIPKSSLSKKIKGTQPIYREDLEKLSEAMEKPIEWFFVGYLEAKEEIGIDIKRAIENFPRIEDLLRHAKRNDIKGLLVMTRLFVEELEKTGPEQPREKKSSTEQDRHRAGNDK